ncbi:hypothetical protein [Nostoc sp. T09]|uniref:hypothetical protein n=1 Tax=Nostoc sp. T09 TaxID=1932621 RepID=UPI00117E63F4|nr:hypothetical protein [Nostoc sp. T09]
MPINILDAIALAKSVIATGLTQKSPKTLIYRRRVGAASRRVAACRTPTGKQATRSVFAGEGYRQDALDTQ